jgi:hypothetical protein
MAAPNHEARPAASVAVTPAWPGFRWAGWEWSVAGAGVRFEGYCRTRFGARRRGRQVLRWADPAAAGRGVGPAPVTALATAAARRTRRTGPVGGERRSA